MNRNVEAPLPIVSGYGVLHTFVSRSVIKCWPGAGPKRAGFGPRTRQDGSILAAHGEDVVRAGGLEPPRPVRVCGFSYRFGFRRPASAGSWSGLSLHHSSMRFRCCPSSLYTFPKVSGLGSGLPVKVSPTLSSSTPPVSLAGTQIA
jgi:hypothetical protein